MSKRENQIISGILNDGFEFKGIKFKPMSARILLLLEKVKSPFYVGGDQLRGLLDFLFIASKESRDVLKAINEGTWDETIMEYADSFTADDLQDLAELVEAQSEDASAAVVDVKSTAEKKT
jgi:hypothetical protein